MGYQWRAIIFCLCITACYGDYEIQNTASPQSTTTPECYKCPKKTTTTHHTTTLHTTHSTTPQTTAHTNHTTTPQTTLRTNHTTAPHTNHTTTHTTLHTNHTTAPHTNHTTVPHTNHTTAHTNHTTAHTTLHTNHTTAHTNHTTAHTTPHHTTMPHTHHTTQHPTTMPPPSDYFVNSTSGVCLRIMAYFQITFNDTKTFHIVIPPPPTTKASGNCSAEKAQLTLSFPEGQLTLTFRQNIKDSFYLGAVNISLKNVGSEKFGNASLKAMVTPLGRSFSCQKVDVEVNPKVTFVVMNVRAQAFNLQGGNYGRELKCSDGSHSMTVPIVIGVILVVLVLIVVIAYLIARQRNSHRGYEAL